MADTWYHIKRNLNPRTIYYNLKYGIGNLIFWFYIIWTDRDWDNYFLYAMLHKKLVRMEKLYRFHGSLVSSENSANQLRICKCLLKRLMEEKYFDYSIIPDDWNISRPLPPLISEKLSKEAKHEEYLIEQDLDLLFKTMRKCVRGWWD